MHIERIYISGYGIFHEFSLPESMTEDCLPLSLVVVAGPNESGKTTLLSFIRAILFGFPDMKSNKYSPQAGGRHGGHITIANTQGESYIIERFAGKYGGSVSISMPDGSQGGDSDLNILLGNANKDLFRNVFAFSLSELQNFETLTNKEVSRQIYSVGLGVGAIGLHKIEDSLEKKHDDLFTTERATSKDIAKSLSECTRIQKHLNSIIRETSKYESLKNDLRRLDKKIEAKRNERNKAKAALSHLQGLIKSWEIWLNLQSAKEKIQKLPEIKRFPTDGISRLEVINERLRSASKAVEEIERKLEQHESKLGNLNVNELILQHKPQIQSLQQGLNKYESARKGFFVLKAELAATSNDLKVRLSELGIGWDERRVVDFDTSIPAREAVREHDLSIANKKQTLHDADIAMKSASKELLKAQKDMEQLKKQFGDLSEPLIIDKSTLKEQLRTGRGLLTGITGFNILQQQSDHLEERQRDRSSHANSIKYQLEQGVYSYKLPFILKAILLLIPILGWLVLFYLKRVSFHSLEYKEKCHEDLERLEDELRRLNARIEQARKETGKKENSLRTLSEQLQFTEIPQLGDIDAYINDKQSELETLSKWQESQQRIAEATQRVTDAEEILKETTKLKKEAEDAWGKEKREWAKWLATHKVELACSPNTVLELMSKVESTREVIKAIEVNRKRISSVEDEIKNYEENANSVLRSCHRKECSGTELSAEIDKLIVSLDETAKDYERLVQLQGSIEEIKEDREARKEALLANQEELERLMADADVIDEEEFRSCAKTLKEREQLQIIIDECTRNLELIAGHGNALTAFMHELDSTTPEKLKGNERIEIERLDTLEKDLDDMQKNWGGLKQQVEELEREEETSDLRLRLNVLKEELKSKSYEWCTLTAALQLLRGARAKYERERKPAVVQEGQQLFSRITNGRYPRLISPIGETHIEVENHVGQRKSLSALSRGTAEQLYLALRFGLVREFSRRAEVLPLIMDDVLVNFDSGRAKETCCAIADIAQTNQIIYFTCHPETVEMIKSNVKNCRIIELPKVVS